MALKMRHPLPPEIKNAPKLSPHLVLPWKCFWALRVGVDKYSISKWTDVQAWCNAYGVEGAQAEFVHTGVVVLSGEWLKLNPRPATPGPNGNSGGNKRR